MKQYKRKAFTLVELLIVLVVIAVLFVIYISKVNFASDKAKLTGVQTDFRSFYLATRAVVAESNINDIKISGAFEEALNKNLEQSIRFTSGTCSDQSPFETPYKLITRNVEDGLEVLFYTDTTKNATVYYSGLDLKKSLDSSIDLSNKAAWGCKLTVSKIQDMTQTEAEEIRNPGPVPSNVTDYYTYTLESCMSYTYLDEDSYLVSLTSAFKTALESNSGSGTAYKDWVPGSPLPNPGSTYNGKPVADMSSMFYNSQATSLDLSNFDTSNVTNMSDMFDGSQAASLNLSSFDTSKVKNMSSMFYNSQAASLDLSNFNTYNVLSMRMMFWGSQATVINTSNFDTSNTTDLCGMFYLTNVATLSLSNFNTSKVTDMSEMFGNSAATIIDVSSFDTVSVKTMQEMFCNSQATSLDLSNFNTANVTNMNGMFEGSATITLDLSSFDTSKVTNINNMFLGSLATTGYARTQSDADTLNSYMTYKPSTLTFIVKP